MKVGDRIIIVKSTLESYWYAQHIGEVFTIEIKKQDKCFIDKGELRYITEGEEDAILYYDQAQVLRIQMTNEIKKNK